jgi:hypothetical protein
MNAALHPYAEMPPGAAIRNALKWQVVGLLLLAYHVFLVKQSVAFVVVMPVLLAALYTNAPLAGLLVYFQFLIYQNFIIALAVPGMTHLNFTVLQGTNFLAITLMAGIGAGRLFLPPWRQETKGLMAVVIVAVLVAGCYAVLGTLRAGPTSAAVYFREFIGPACAVVVGLDVGRAWGFRTVAIGLLISVILSLAIALIEIAAPVDYYTWVNAADFANMKSACCIANWVFGPLGVIDQNTSNLFNFSGDSADYAATGVSFRFMSSLMHPISYAYVLAVAGLAAISLRQYLWLIVLAPLMIAIGVKGAAVLFVFSLCFWTILVSSRSGGVAIASAAVLLTVYVIYGVAHGLEYNDFHAIGFVGGWHGFLRDPLGHGLGVGGNLSASATSIHWTGTGSIQTIGADFGMESAVGVLIYQMGIGSLAIFAIFVRLLWRAPFFTRKPQGRDVWFLALATVMINGVFQEEAYAPTAAGLIALLCAVVLINEQREAISLTRPAKLVARPTYA